MNDEYRKMRREQQSIELGVIGIRVHLHDLIRRFEQSDHPLRHRRLAELRELLDKLTY